MREGISINFSKSAFIKIPINGSIFSVCRKQQDPSKQKYTNPSGLENVPLYAVETYLSTETHPISATIMQKEANYCKKLKKNISLIFIFMAEPVIIAYCT